MVAAKERSQHHSSVENPWGTQAAGKAGSAEGGKEVPHRDLTIMSGRPEKLPWGVGGKIPHTQPL